MTMTSETLEPTEPLWGNAPRVVPAPLAVQILSTIFFGSFAIVAVIFAFIAFWPAGLALAAVLGWRGGFAPNQTSDCDMSNLMSRVNTREHVTDPLRSGNISFDAYRADVLQRLEEERQRFDMFLGRLRAAKDQSEFDRFMDQRAMTQAEDQRDA